jgi:integrase
LKPHYKDAKISDFHWHDLRHTFASRLVMAGVDLRTVQDLMGHKSIQMTVRHPHLAPPYQLAAVERLADVGDATKGPTGAKTSTGVFADEIALHRYVV